MESTTFRFIIELKIINNIVWAEGDKCTNLNFLAPNNGSFKLYIVAVIQMSWNYCSRFTQKNTQKTNKTKKTVTMVRKETINLPTMQQPLLHPIKFRQNKLHLSINWIKAKCIKTNWVASKPAFSTIIGTNESILIMMTS